MYKRRICITKNRNLKDVQKLCVCTFMATGSKKIGNVYLDVVATVLAYE